MTRGVGSTWFTNTLAKWSFLLLSLPACVGANGGKPSAMIIRSGDVEVAIPERNITDRPPAWIRLIPGLRDDSDATGIVFPAAELVSAVPGLPAVEDIRGTLAVLESASEAQATREANLANVADLWLGRGRFAGRVVEPIPGHAAARVFDRWEFSSRSGWTVVAYPPTTGSAGPPRDDRYVLGHCQPMGPIGNRRAICLTPIQVDRITLSIYMSEVNLLTFPQLHDVLRRRLDEWRVSNK